MESETTTNCPYCNCSTNNIDDAWLSCYNHGEIVVRFWNWKRYINNIYAGDKVKQKLYYIGYKDYYIYLYPKDNFMNICFNYFDSPDNSITLPIDPNLTPENFEQKLKTYLTFQ